MLVQYSIDDNEDDIKASAVEIRKRIASRHLDNKIKQGIIDEDTLIHMKDLSRKQLKEHGKDHLTITLTDVKEKVAVARAEQQLNLESTLHTLERDINRASRLSKSRLDALNDLERRIQMMRHQLKEPHITTPNDEIGLELRKDNKAEIERLFYNCIRCKRRILVELHTAHEEQCAKLNGNLELNGYDDKVPVYDPNQDIVTSLTTFLPQPPRLFKVKATGSSFIHWEWDPPISDGGLPITDYELSYTIKSMTMNPKTHKYIVDVQFVPSWRTTHWCLLDPICHRGYKMVALKANTEYMDFKIRCCNLRGWSEWANMMPEGVKSIHTQLADPPTQPRLFKITRVTSSCAYLEWEPPYFDGGLEICDYAIFYTVIVRSSTVKERTIYTELPFRYNIGYACTSAVVRNITSDSLVVKISIKAINKAGVHSEATNLDIESIKTLLLNNGTVTKEQYDAWNEKKKPGVKEKKKKKDDNEIPIEVRTQKCCRHTLIKKELYYAMNHTEDFIDSDFYAGVHQRLLKVDFIKKLQAELEVTEMDEEEEMELKTWADIKEARLAIQRAVEAEAAAKKAEEEMIFDDDLDSQSAGGSQKAEFNNSQRRAHFRQKLLNIKNKVTELQQERLDLDSGRIRMTQLIKDWQKRQTELRLEFDRVSNFKGEIVTSSVLIGAPMQYKFQDFLTKLNAAIGQVQEDIAKAKYKIINGEKRKQIVRAMIPRAEEELKTKQALFLQFQQDCDKQRKAMERLHNADQSDVIMRLAWKLWMEYLNELRAVRQRILNTFTHVIRRYKKSAFEKWKTGNFDADSKNTSAFFSVGSILLKQAEEKRTELQAELRQTIAQTNNIFQSLKIFDCTKENRQKLLKSAYFKGQEEGMDHEKLEIEGMIYLYEADGYASVGNFMLAASMYEAQIMYLRSKPSLNIKLLAFTHGRFGKMFLKQSRFERATVEFDRQLSLGKEVDDKVEIAESYLGIGLSYRMRNMYEEAIKYLEIAQVRLGALGNMQKCGIAIKGLRDCYMKQGKLETAQIYAEKVSELDGEMKYKVNLINRKLADMTERLTNTAAEIEHVVQIERTTYRALMARKAITNKTKELRKLEKKHEDSIDDVKNHEEFLNKIQGEIDEAFKSDELEMMTYVIHSQPQVVEIEELKTRLNQMKVKELKHYQELKQTEHTIYTQMKNLDDDLIHEDETLKLEEGELMKHIRHDRPFRLTGFCGANVAGNEVTGTNSGGFENFLCAEGPNIHVVDYHTGELLNVMIGDDKGRFGEKKGHTGVVTALCHDGVYLFSGSADETIISWHGVSWQKLKIFEGHEGTVTALHACAGVLASGAADCTIRLWDKTTAIQLRVLYGHSKSIMSLEIGMTWLVSGSGDEEVRLWSLKRGEGENNLQGKCKKRLIGHEQIVTIVKYGQLEILSGDILGRIFIWWAESGNIVKICQIHSGPIKTLQFDAIVIVSGGTDQRICITDVGTGEVIESLRGHEGHILGIAFDSERIISVAGDNTLRYWKWGQKATGQDKVHVLNRGETLVNISKLYDISVADIMKWNGILEMRHCYEGMKLIVRKGDPDKPTVAEAVALERERRNEQGRSLIAKKMSDSKDFGTSKLKKYDRVQKLAMDLDFHSMGNRMFSKDKRDLELFPSAEVERDLSSLNERLKHDHSIKRDESKVKPRYFITSENVEEWGHIADSVMVAMIGMFIEYTAYEITLENKRENRDMGSVIGRIYGFENKIDGVGMKVAKATALASIKANMKRSRKHIGMSKKRMLIAEAEAKMLEAFEQDERNKQEKIEQTKDVNNVKTEINHTEDKDYKNIGDENNETLLNDDYDIDGMLSPEKKVLLDEFLETEDNNKVDNNTIESSQAKVEINTLPLIENITSKSPRTQNNEKDILILPSI